MEGPEAKIWIYWSPKDTDNPGVYEAKRDADGEYIFTKNWVPKGKDNVQINSPDAGDWHDQDAHPLHPLVPDFPKTGGYNKHLLEMLIQLFFEWDD